MTREETEFHQTLCDIVRKVEPIASAYTRLVQLLSAPPLIQEAIELICVALSGVTTVPVAGRGIRIPHGTVGWTIS